MTEAEQIMKRCQAGTRNYEEANNLHAACYGMIGKLLAQRTWVGLTVDEIETIWRKVEAGDFHDCVLPFAEKLEARLKEKNCA